MRRQGDDAAVRPQDRARDLLPERCAGDVLITDMMDRHHVRRDRPAGVYQDRAALAIHAPFAVRTQHDVLPSDLADVPGFISSSLEVDDADTRVEHAV